MQNPAQAPLVFASGSPRRRELLASLGAPFDVRPTDADESVPDGLAADQAVRRIAIRKLNVARSSVQSGATIVVADTIVVMDGRMLGKPRDAAEARAMLTDLRGRQHDVLTAVGVESLIARSTALARTSVVMRALTDAEIEESIAAETPFDKAGGYAIQDPALHPVEQWNGCYCNVMGLPLWSVYHLLRRLDALLPLVPPDATYERCTACPLRNG